MDNSGGDDVTSKAAETVATVIIATKEAVNVTRDTNCNEFQWLAMDVSVNQVRQVEESKVENEVSLLPCP